MCTECVKDGNIGENVYTQAHRRQPSDEERRVKEEESTF